MGFYLSEMGVRYKAGLKNKTIRYIKAASKEVAFFVAPAPLL